MGNINKYFTLLFRTTSLITLSLILSIGTFIVYASISWPPTPTDKIQGGNFSKIFSECPTGQVLKGFSGTTYEPICIPNGNSGGGFWDDNGTKIYYNTGNVGIGYTNPSYKLSVYGSGYFSDDISSNGQFKAGATADTETNPGFTWHNDNDTGIYNFNGNRIGFTTSGSTRMMITSSGVGIGTGSPAYKLDVGGDFRLGKSSGDHNSDGFPDYDMGGFTTSYDSVRASRIYNFFEYDDPVVLSGRQTKNKTSKDAEISFFNGSVGVGIHEPSSLYKLHVVGKTFISDDIITNGQFQAGATADSATNPGFTWFSDPNTGIYNHGADQIGFTTNGTAKMIINATGNVGIGATPGTTYKLDVNGSLNTTSLCIDGDCKADWNSVFAGSFVGFGCEECPNGYEVYEVYPASGNGASWRCKGLKSTVKTKSFVAGNKVGTTIPRNTQPICQVRGDRFDNKILSPYTDARAVGSDESLKTEFVLDL